MSEENPLIVNLAIAALQTLATVVVALIVSSVLRRIWSKIPRPNKNTPVVETVEVSA